VELRVDNSSLVIGILSSFHRIQCGPQSGTEEIMSKLSKMNGRAPISLHFSDILNIVTVLSYLRREKSIAAINFR
jgi:hypothetical protein